MGSKGHSDFGPIFWIHIVILTIIYSCPFWVDWRIILVGIFTCYLQWWLCGGCILTRRQFEGTKERITFHWYYLSKLGFRFSQKNVDRCVDYFVPWFLLAMAYIWQVVL